MATNRMSILTDLDYKKVLISSIDSVWAVPDSETKEFQEFNDTIQSFSQRFGGPAFHPHITLASFPQVTCIDNAKDAFQAAVKTLAEEPVQFDSVQQGQPFFRSVFAHVHPSSTERLRQIQGKIYESIGLETGKEIPEFAHLSLYYGTDSEAKKTMAEEASNLNVISNSIGAKFASLWLVDCSGPVGKWEVLLKVDDVAD